MKIKKSFVILNAGLPDASVVMLVLGSCRCGLTIGRCFRLGKIELKETLFGLIVSWLRARLTVEIY